MRRRKTLHDEVKSAVSRRHFLRNGSDAIGWAALSSLIATKSASAAGRTEPQALARPDLPHHSGRAKHVIYLHMVGGPPQVDMFDHKPDMQKWFDKDLPDSVRMGQRLTTMTSGQARFPIAPSKYQF